MSNKSSRESTVKSVKTKATPEDWRRLQKEHPAILPNEDNINPSHYKSGDIECIDAMCSAFGRAQVIKWAEVNAFKYLFRMHKKGPRVENIEKAIWMLEFALGKDPRTKP